MICLSGAARSLIAKQSNRDEVVKRALQQVIRTSTRVVATLARNSNQIKQINYNEALRAIDNADDKR